MENWMDQKENSAVFSSTYKFLGILPKIGLPTSSQKAQVSTAGTLPKYKSEQSPLKTYFFPKKKYESLISRFLNSATIIFMAWRIF